MKWIKYQILQSVIDEQPILVNKKVGYNDANLAIAQTEAYNGEYTIEEDEEDFEKEPLAIELGGTGAKTVEDACKNIGGINTYVHSADGLTGVGENGKFKATSSGTISSINIGAKTYNVRQGEDTSIDLVEGCWYTFILDGTTINFNSGGAGSIKVKGGTSYPASPKEGMIWVKTSTSIGKVYLKEKVPNDAPNGSVCFLTSGKEAEFQFLKRVEINATGAFQKINGTWTGVETYIYKNGAWSIVSSGILYKPGNQMTAYTGGWTGAAKLSSDGSGVSAKTPSITRGEESIIADTSANGGGGIFYAANKIDLTPYKTVKFKGKFTRGGSVEKNLCAAVWSSIGTYYTSNMLASTYPSTTNTSVINIDVESVNREAYVGLGLTQSKAEMTNITLIPKDE